MQRTVFSFFVALGLVFAGSAQAAPVRTENVEAELHSSHTGFAPGERISVALRLKMREGWHTYWRNAGDSGEATEIAWNLPDGFKAGPILWPIPHVQPVGPITNYGYEGEILLPMELETPAQLAEGEVVLRARVRWLVCSDVCIPEEAQLQLPLRVGKGVIDGPWAARISQALSDLPQMVPMAGVLRRNGDGSVQLSGEVPQWAKSKTRGLYFFPFERDQIEHAAAQPGRIKAGTFALTLQPQPNGLLGKQALSGVLSAEILTPKGWKTQAVEISAQPGAPAPQPSAIRAAPQNGGIGGANLGWGGAVVFAFLGGLILNIMPCVFPVLSIKALSFASVPAQQARRHGLMFLLGVMTTFLALAGLLIGLQAAGAAIGWGFQLQQPLVVAGLALVFFVLGLNLLGMFEMGASLQGLGSGLAAHSGDLGAFATGALAVIAASPCTAPFMGGALGFAATQAPAISLSVFAALGLGFALPFTLLSFAPAARTLLPRPGPWMARFKEALAFPMLATAIYLAWVLTQQRGADGALALLSAMLAIGFGIWAFGASRQLWLRGAAGALCLTVLGAALFGLMPKGAAPAPDAQLASSQDREIAAKAWSAPAVEAARAQGRLVLVNFTAAWCVTCKVNEALVFSRPEIRNAFAAHKIAYFVGDWTSQDKQIAAELARHGRQGVPLYLLYRPGQEAPEILPQQLSVDGLIGALGSG